MWKMCWSSSQVRCVSGKVSKSIKFYSYRCHYLESVINKKKILKKLFHCVSSTASAAFLGNFAHYTGDAEWTVTRLLLAVMQWKTSKHEQIGSCFHSKGNKIPQWTAFLSKLFLKVQFMRAVAAKFPRSKCNEGQKSFCFDCHRVYFWCHLINVNFPPTGDEKLLHLNSRFHFFRAFERKENKTSESISHELGRFVIN